LSQVLVYSAEGEYVRSLSRQGEGPGESQSPRGLIWLPGGGLGIIDRRMGQITAIDAGGDPLDSVRLLGRDGEPMASAQLGGAKCRGGTLAICATQYVFGDGPPRQTRIFSIFDQAGREVECLLEAPSGFDFGARTYDELTDYFVDQGAWAIDHRGFVYHAPRYDQYRIDVHDPGGQLVQVIERVFVPGKRSDEDKSEIVANTTMTIDGVVVQIECDLQENHGAIDLIEISANGQIWVANGRDNHDLPPGILRTFDVFDSDGIYREVVHVAGEGDLTKDLVYHLADDRWVILRNIISARRAMFSRFRNVDGELDEVAEVEPLEIVCLRGGAQ